MEIALQRFYKSGLAVSTQKAYTSGQKRFLAFCNQFNLLALPLSEHTIMLFISQLGVDGLSMSTIKSYLASLRNLLINNGLQNISIYSPRVELVLRGIKRVKGSSAVSKVRLPITPDILVALKKVWGSNTPDNRMFWAAACLGFFGFLRCAEFTSISVSAFDPAKHLTVGDVFVKSDKQLSSMAVRLKMSKTDQFGKGVWLHFQRTGVALCPVEAMVDYIQLRGSKEGPLFLTSHNQPLTRSYFLVNLRNALAQAGIDDSQYAGHSFRIGAATTVLRAGVSDAKIKMLGRWESSAYQLYLRTPRQELASIAPILAKI